MTLRGSSPAALPDSDDLLWEILLRLPPQPSSLVRASAVCRRWRRLVTDPLFLDRFRAHHREPPVLGVFEYHINKYRYMFRPLMDSPDRIPPERFDLGSYSVRNEVLGCRHGRVLILNHVQEEVVVCTPFTGEQSRVAVPPEFKEVFKRLNGTVLCAASDQGHVHGGCHSSPFKVVMVSADRKENLIFARVYSSETGVWGNLISLATPSRIFLSGVPAALVGNALYWQISCMTSTRDDILEFDLEEQSLSVIGAPPLNKIDFNNCQIIQGEDGTLGLATFSFPRFQMWQRSADGHGVATWVLWKTVNMHNILPLPHPIEGHVRVNAIILGYSEDIDVIFIYVDVHLYMVQLKTMESKRLYKTYYTLDYHPFTSFYTPGASIAGGCNGAEMLHDT